MQDPPYEYINCTQHQEKLEKLYTKLEKQLNKEVWRKQIRFNFIEGQINTNSRSYTFNYFNYPVLKEFNIKVRNTILQVLHYITDGNEKALEILRNGNTISFNKNTKSKPHEDVYNQGKSIIFCIGDFQPNNGLLYIQHDKDVIEINAKRKPVIFNPLLTHWNNWQENETRYSIVIYNSHKRPQLQNLELLKGINQYKKKRRRNRGITKKIKK